MKKIIVGVIIGILICCILGFSLSPTKVLDEKNIEILTDITDGNLSVASKENEENISIYTDGQYMYYLNNNTDTLDAITPCTDFDPAKTTKDAIYLTNDYQKILSISFGTNIDHFVERTTFLDGIGKILEVREVYDNTETGNKGSFIYTYDDILLSAVILRGNVNIDTDSIIDSDEAVRIAVEELKGNDLILSINSTKVDSCIKYFQKQYYWNVEINASTLVNGNIEEINYYINVDAVSGDVIIVENDIY